MLGRIATIVTGIHQGHGVVQGRIGKIHPDHAEDLGRDLIIRLATAVCEITEREKDVGALEWAGSVVRLVQDLEAATVAAGARRRCAGSI